jgi:hypothetical protein
MNNNHHQPPTRAPEGDSVSRRHARRLAALPLLLERLATAAREQAEADVRARVRLEA